MVEFRKWFIDHIQKIINRVINEEFCVPISGINFLNRMFFRNVFGSIHFPYLVDVVISYVLLMKSVDGYIRFMHILIVEMEIIFEGNEALGIFLCLLRVMNTE